MQLFELDGKKAIVTGGAAGLAYGMAEALLEAGAEVVVIDLAPQLEESVASLCKTGPAHGIRGDISDRAGLKALYAQALALLGGRLDILVNAAGIQRRHPSEAFPAEDWDQVLAVNLTAVFQLCQLAGRTMLAQKSGKIINIASMLSYFGGYTVPAYAASKGGVAQITKALANEWAQNGINVNAIAPGYMDTSMNEKLVADPERNAAILNRIPARRWGTPADVKGVVVFLSSAASEYLHGAVIPVDGGYLGC